MHDVRQEHAVDVDVLVVPDTVLLEDQQTVGTTVDGGGESRVTELTSDGVGTHTKET